MEEEIKRGSEAVYKNKKRIIVDNFLGGLFWGLGTVIGATVVVALLAFLVSKFNFIPGFSDFIGQVTEVVNQNGQQSPLQR